jgi:hypothetical protein
MPMEVEGKTYLSSEDVKNDPSLGYSRDTLYRMRAAGLIKAYHFFGDTKTYWDLTELTQAKQQPRERNKKRNPD